MATSMISCPYCGKLTDPRLDNCVHCGGFLRKRSAPGRPKAKTSSETCAKCGALVQEGDIICVACGTNLLTGQRIASEDQAPARRRKIPLPPLKWVLIAVAGLLGLLVLILLIALLAAGRDSVARAMRLKEQGQTVEAANMLQRIIDKKPDAPRAHFELGLLRWESGDYRAAGQSFQRAARSEPDNREAYLRAALSLALLGDASTRNEEAALLEALADRFNDPNGWLLLGLARGTMGDTAGQVQALRRAVETASDPNRVRVLLGVAHALSDDTAAARRELAVETKIVPDDAEWLAMSALIHAEEDETPRAAALLEMAVDRELSWQGDALTQLGLLLLAEGRVDEAKTYLSRAMAQRVTNPEVRFFHALCLKEQRLYEEAAAELDAVAAASGPYAADAAVFAAEVYLTRGDPTRALASIERAQQLGSASALFHTVRGRLQVASDNLSGARESFSKAIQADGDYAPARLEYGLLSVKRGLTEEGIAALERYLELVDPTDRDSRAGEVEAFVNQLRKSAGRETPA